MRATRQQVEAAIAGKTVAGVFLDTVARRPGEEALRWEAAEGWCTMTWQRYAERVGAVAAGLLDRGLRRGDRVGILMRNRPEFHVADVATIFAGGTPVSIYNSSSPEQIRALLAHSAATAIVVEDSGMLERVEKVRAEIPTLREVVVVDGPGGDVGFAELLAHPPIDLARAAAEITPGDLATVIYTSGTTGDPKGVMLTHANVVCGVEIYTEVLARSLEGFRQLSYLPMAHIAERLATHYFHVVHGSLVTCCPDINQIARYMVDVRPQWWFCAPRLWEKLHGAIRAMLAAAPDLEARFDAALAVGARVSAIVHEQGGEVPAALAAEWPEVRTEVILPVLARVGLDGVEIAISGSAPMPRPVHQFFLDCGLPLSDCYGQSETTGFVSWDPDRVRPGTSGRPFPGVEVRLDDEDGEILVRGANVFAGYLDDPEQTAAVLDGDGWLRTGDIGSFDDDGNLIVVDRKKEILVPSSGHKVSPVALEAALKESPLVAQACAVGDGRPFVAALVVLDPETVPKWAAASGVDSDTLEELADDAAVRRALQAHVDEINERFAPAEQVRAFAVLGSEWLPDSELLTPTAKLKRRGVHARYENEIDRLYA